MPTYRNDSTSRKIYVENTTGCRVAVSPGETVQTYKRQNDADLTLTSESPYYNLAMDENEVTASEAGWDTQAVDSTARYLEVYTTVDVTLHANDLSAGGFRLMAGQSRQIYNDGRIATLHIYFTGAGAVTVNELAE